MAQFSVDLRCKVEILPVCAWIWTFFSLQDLTFMLHAEAAAEKGWATTFGSDRKLTQRWAAAQSWYARLSPLPISGDLWLLKQFLLRGVKKVRERCTKQLTRKNRTWGVYKWISGGSCSAKPKMWFRLHLQHPVHGFQRWHLNQT